MEPLSEVPAVFSACALLSLDVAFVLVVTVAGVGFWRQRKRAAAARAKAEQASFPLRPGAAVVTGEVATLDDRDDATVLRIEQKGTVRHVKGGQQIAWDESNRTLDVKPFDLLLRGGERVRVEPDEDIELVDDLDGKWTGRDGVRERYATLTRGERATVTGVLRREEGGYREAQGGWRLAPAKGERMLVSTEPLPRRFEARARVHGIWLALAIAGLAATVGFIAEPYHELLFSGRREIARVESVKYTPGPKRQPGRMEIDWVVDERGSRGTVEVAPWLYERLITPKDRPAVPVMVGPFGAVKLSWDRWPTIDGGRLLGAVALGLAIIVGYMLHAFFSRPWYDRKRLDEDEHR